MSKAQLPGHGPESLTPPATHAVDFSSSRMLDEYLAELEDLLSREQWPEALRTALELPHIAAALSDRELQSSRERYENWCADWVHVGAASEFPVASDALYQMWNQQAQPESVDRAPPLHALTQLRLHRLLRPVRSSGSRTDADTDEHEVTEKSICAALMGAARRWYAYRGSRDATVQLNLGRLAVLR